MKTTSRSNSRLSFSRIAATLAVLAAAALATTTASAHHDCDGGCKIGEYRVTLDTIKVTKFSGSIIPPDTNPDVIIRTTVQPQTHGSQVAVFGEYENTPVGNVIHVGKLVYWHLDCTPGEPHQVTIELFDEDTGFGDVLKLILETGGGIVAGEFPEFGGVAKKGADVIGKAVQKELNALERFPQMWTGNPPPPFKISPNAGTLHFYFKDDSQLEHSFEAWMTFQYLEHDKPCSLDAINELTQEIRRKDPEVNELFRRLEDDDGDGVSNQVEKVFESDPKDKKSKPEHHLYSLSGNVCQDGIDNDGDGRVDADDPRCAFVDSDSDGIEDRLDNCPDVANPGQKNSDADSLGDACDDDKRHPPLEERETYFEQVSYYSATVLGTVATNDFYFGIGPCGQLVGFGTHDGKQVPFVKIGSISTPLAGLGERSQALAVNSDGWIAGQYFLEAGFQPFFAPRGGPMIPLPTLGGGLGSARSISDTSKWIAGVSAADASPLAPWHPVVWEVLETGGETSARIHALPSPEGRGGYANDVNNRGEIVGFVEGEDFVTHAVIWQPGSEGRYRIVDLGADGSANAISDSGAVAGALRRGDRHQAFWSPAGEAILLPGIPGCESCETFANDINERGEVVGSAIDADGVQHAVRWDTRSLELGLVDLNAGLPASFREESVLEYASGINGAGQIVVTGRQRGELRTFLMTPELSGVDLDRNGIPDACEATPTLFSRGDVNNDARVDLADAISILGVLFTGKEAPACAEAADANDDGEINITDAVTTLDYLFRGTSRIAPPSGACGLDPTPDDLGCGKSMACSDASVPVAEKPCEGGSLRVLWTRWECRKGFWTLVTYGEYVCPDGTFQSVEDSAQATEQRCP